jgi:hypothetical protein
VLKIISTYFHFPRKPTQTNAITYIAVYKQVFFRALFIDKIFSGEMCNQELSYGEKFCAATNHNERTTRRGRFITPRQGLQHYSTFFILLKHSAFIPNDVSSLLPSLKRANTQ